MPSNKAARISRGLGAKNMLARRYVFLAGIIVSSQTLPIDWEPVRSAHGALRLPVSCVPASLGTVARQSVFETKVTLGAFSNELRAQCMCVGEQRRRSTTA